MDEQMITDELLGGFEHHLQAEERSSGTIEKYLRDVRAFRRWLAGAALTRTAAADWKAALLAAGYRPVTINSMLAALNSFLTFCGRSDCRVRSLRLQRRLFRSPERELTRSEYERLLAAARSSGRGDTALLMEAICATGIRVSEVCYLTVEAARTGRAEVSLKGKIRTILLPNRLCRKLLQLAGQKKITTGAIFLGADGRCLSRKQIWSAMKALCGRAGVAASKVFPHNLRHLFARAFYQVCHDVVKLADLLGHSSVETTRIYLISTGTEHSRELERLGLVT